MQFPQRRYNKNINQWNKTGKKNPLGQKKNPKKKPNQGTEWFKLGCGDELEESELCDPHWFDGHRENFHIQTFNRNLD